VKFAFAAPNAELDAIAAPLMLCTSDSGTCRVSTSAMYALRAPIA
jgi:hypothetical protein